MRTITKYITILMIMLSLGACEKDGDKITVSGFDASVLSLNNDNIVLSLDNKDNEVLSIAWTKDQLTLSNPTMNAPASMPSFVVEASTSSGFESSITINPTANPHIITGLQLNTLAKNLSLEANVSSPVYFRVNSALGKNTPPKYSNVLTVNVTPYEVDMSRGFILNTDKEETGYILYAPNSDGEYSGFMNATAWYNWYLGEGDGTTWGNLPVDGNEFVLSSDESSHWNFWFPGLGGCYYTTLSTNTKEWTATYMPALTAAGDVTGDLTYVKGEVYWFISFTTTADNGRFTVSGDAKLYNKSTGTTDDAAIDKNIAFLPQSDNSLSFSFTEQASEFVVPTAGEYTLKLFLSDPTNLNYTITEGGTVIEEPISEYLYLPGIDDGISGSWTFDNYLRLISDVDSTFAGVVNVNSLWGYNMSLIIDEWNDVYKMGAAEGLLQFAGGSNIPAPDPGLYLIKADLKNLTYSHTAVSSLSHAGLNDNWDLSPMNETTVPGVYAASVTINAASEWGCKLYMNANWDEFFGGADGALTYLGSGIVDDATIDAGTYDLIANLCDASYVFLGNEVYITGFNDVWDFTTVVLTKTETGVYKGTATINAPSPWGMAIHIDQSWNRYFGGSFAELKYLGDNITDDQSLAAGTYNVTVDFINNTCTFTLAE